MWIIYMSYVAWYALIPCFRLTFNTIDTIECLLFVGDPDSVAGEFGRHPLYKMLGYFSLVALLRLHSLLGDYYQAIKVLENIELNKKVCILFNFVNFAVHWLI